MSLFNFVRNLWSSPEERKMRRAKRVIEGCGGASLFISASSVNLALIGGKEKIIQGSFDSENFPIDPFNLGVASIHCMMDAKSKLAESPNNPESAKELQFAEEMFLISTLMQLDIKDFIDGETSADAIISTQLTNRDIVEALAKVSQDARQKRLDEAKRILQSWQDFDFKEFVPYVKLIVEQ
jgi:hypothetical protein